MIISGGVGYIIGFIAYNDQLRNRLVGLILKHCVCPKEISLLKYVIFEFFIFFLRKTEGFFTLPIENPFLSPKNTSLISSSPPKPKISSSLPEPKINLFALDIPYQTLISSILLKRALYKSINKARYDYIRNFHL
jgi:hypothetical protein